MPKRKSALFCGAKCRVYANRGQKAPVVQKSPVVDLVTGEVKEEMGMQEKLATLRIMMESAGQKNSLAPPEVPTVVEAYSDDERYSEDEIPEEYIMKQ